MTDRPDTRTAIVEAAARLLRDDGPGAVTTRGVAEAAGVQAPAIYRLFGDKDGLLDAVAEQVMATYVAAKATGQAAAAAGVDPFEDLRAGWQAQIEFSLANPTVFRLLSDPNRVRHSPAAVSGRKVLESKVHRVAMTGRLRVDESRAVNLIQAAGIGAIQMLLSTPEERRDAGLADSMYEAVLRQILTDGPEPAEVGPMATTVAFRAVAPQLHMLSAAEQTLLTEWLNRAVGVLQSDRR